MPSRRLALFERAEGPEGQLVRYEVLDLRPVEGAELDARETLRDLVARSMAAINRPEDPADPPGFDMPEEDDYVTAAMIADAAEELAAEELREQAEEERLSRDDPSAAEPTRTGEDNPGHARAENILISPAKEPGEPPAVSAGAPQTG